MDKKKIVWSVLVLSAFLLLLVGSGSPSSTSSTSSSSSNSSADTAKIKEFYKIGETATAYGAEMTVVKVDKSNGTEYDKPKSGNEFVIVTVKIKNSSKEKLSYNPLYFKMQNSKGQIQDETISTVNQDTALQSGDLAPGGEVQGTIIFEEPVGDQGLILQYQDNIFSKDVKLQFKLS